MSENTVKQPDASEEHAAEKQRKKRVSWHILPQSFTGGPHGVGQDSLIA